MFICHPTGYSYLHQVKNDKKTEILPIKEDNHRSLFYFDQTFARSSSYQIENKENVGVVLEYQYLDLRNHFNRISRGILSTCVAKENLAVEEKEINEKIKD